MISCAYPHCQEGRSRDTVMLVDRYKYLNLFPCSDLELKLMGHPVSCNGYYSNITFQYVTEWGTLGLKHCAHFQLPKINIVSALLHVHVVRAAYRKCGWGGQTESFQNV